MRLRKNGKRAEQPELKVTRRVIEGERLAAAEDAERARRAELSQLEAEAADLRERLAAVEERLALTRLGEGDPAALTRERDEVEVRLAEICCAIDDARRAASPLQRALAEARLGRAREVAASSAAAVGPARAWVDEREEALAVASRNLAELEGEAARDREAVDAAEEELEVVTAGLAEGEEDPLVRHRERMEKAAQERAKQEDEIVAWAAKQGPTARANVSPHLRERAEQAQAAYRAQREARARELEEQALAERSARSGQPEGPPSEVNPGQPFQRVP